jgi:hypothetical protein
MNYTTVTNPRWNKERTAIECVVTFDEIGTVPFGAVPNDNYAHVREIYARCIAGDFGPIADYVPAPDEGPQPIPNAAESNAPTIEGAQTL